MSYTHRKFKTSNESWIYKTHGVIKFKQEAWWKPYTDTNTELRKKANNYFEKYFLSWWAMQFLGKP